MKEIIYIFFKSPNILYLDSFINCAYRIFDLYFRLNGILFFVPHKLNKFTLNQSYDIPTCSQHSYVQFSTNSVGDSQLILQQKIYLKLDMFKESNLCSQQTSLKRYSEYSAGINFNSG